MARPRTRPYPAPAAPPHAELRALPEDRGTRRGVYWSRWVDRRDGTVYERRLDLLARAEEWMIVPVPR